MYPKGKQALALARMGYKVFPLSVDDPNKTPAEIKKPAIKDWPKLATSDPAQIVKWWEEADFNPAIATLPSNRLVVIDYDCKEGQKGAIALANHRTFDIPEAFAVETPTGGWHLYFRSPEGADIGNSTNQIAENVDVRAQSGGYVLAPGATIHGKPYRKINIVPYDELPELPDWLVRKAKTARTKTNTKKGEILGDLDTPENIRRAQTWLDEEAPDAIQGHGGNNTTYQVACRVRDFGVSKEQCLELLISDWNEIKAAPPWSFEELETLVGNAYQYATLPVGVANATAEFEAAGALIKDGPQPAKRQDLYAVDFDQGAEGALDYMGEPLIDELLDRLGMSAIYGKSNSGKTFIALDIAFHVAAAKKWFGDREVKPGLVVYVAAEGGKGIFKRIAALKKMHNVSGIPLAVVPCPVNLLESGKQSDTRRLIELVRELEAKHGQKCEMLVVDTLSRALSGGDENSSTDMGNFIKHVDRLRAELQTHLMVVHHAGKDIARGARGWSGIQAALDSEIEIHEGKLTVTKQRDIDPIPPLSFRLKGIEIGKRKRDGKPVSSCVVEYRAAPEFSIDLTPVEKLISNAIKDLASKKATKDDCEVTLSFGEIIVHKICCERDMSKPNLSNVLSRLVHKGLIKNPDTDQYVIERSQWL